MIAKQNPLPFSGEFVKLEQVSIPHFLLDFLYNTKPTFQNEAQYIESLILKYTEKRSLADIYIDTALYGNEVGDLIDELHKTNFNIGSIFGFISNVYIPIEFINKIRNLIPGGENMDFLDISMHVGTFVNGVISYFERNHFKNFI